MTATHMQITNAQYHADTSVIGSSGLKLLSKSPKHFWAQYLDPERVRQEPTDAMQFGTLVHALVLEPHTVDDEFVVMPQGIDKRTTAGKNLWAEWEAKNQWKAVIKQEVMEQGKRVAQAILEHPAARLISIRNGCPEFTLYWSEEVKLLDGVSVWVKCKARLDWCVLPGTQFPSGLILDLKTTKDAGLDFAKSAYNLGYPIQAAWYSRAMQIAYGTEELAPFVFIAAEKESPFGVMAYKASNEFMCAGWDECQRLLKIYAQSLTSDVWPCYPETITELNLPKWAKENYV